MKKLVLMAILVTVACPVINAYPDASDNVATSNDSLVNSDESIGWQYMNNRNIRYKSRDENFDGSVTFVYPQLKFRGDFAQVMTDEYDCMHPGGNKDRSAYGLCKLLTGATPQDYEYDKAPMTKIQISLTTDGAFEAVKYFGGAIIYYRFITSITCGGSNQL